MITPVQTTNILEKCIMKPLDMAANSGVVGSVCKQFRKDNTKFITGLGLTSIILKDGLGCYMYVKQSLNNKKIPEDKRKFVAALDLANGGLMILLQIATFLTISKDSVQKKIFNTLFDKLFNRASRKGYQKLLDGQSKEFGKVFSDFHGKSVKTFGALTSLVAAAIIAKRIFVPFIATPLAEKTKAYLYKDEKGNKANAAATDKVEISEANKIKETKSNPNESSNLVKNFQGRLSK